MPSRCRARLRLPCRCTGGRTTTRPCSPRSPPASGPLPPDAPLGRTPAHGRRRARCAAVTAGGIGIDAALALVDDVLLPNNVALDHPRFLAYIPAAPATTAALFDARRRRVVVLRRELAGGRRRGRRRARRPRLAAARSPGCPTAPAAASSPAGRPGNLSALAVARDTWRREHPDAGRPRRSPPRRRPTRRCAAPPRCSTSTSSTCRATSATG